MIPQEDLEFIISDLDNLERAHEKAERYEECAVVKKIIESFASYLNGDKEYKMIVNDLYKVCTSRYALFRKHIFKQKRYAVFFLPNNSLLYFYIDNIKDDSDVWKEIEQEYDKITQLIEESISKIKD